MIVSGWIIFIIGVLAFIGRAIGSAGLSFVAFIIPIFGLILLVCGYVKKNKK